MQDKMHLQPTLNQRPKHQEGQHTDMIAHMWFVEDWKKEMLFILGRGAESKYIFIKLVINS
jgi:hypothetical protein